MKESGQTYCSIQTPIEKILDTSCGRLLLFLTVLHCTLDRAGHLHQSLLSHRGVVGARRNALMTQLKHPLPTWHPTCDRTFLRNWTDLEGLRGA